MAKSRTYIRILKVYTLNKDCDLNTIFSTNESFHVVVAIENDTGKESSIKQRITIIGPKGIIIKYERTGLASIGKSLSLFTVDPLSVEGRYRIIGTLKYEQSDSQLDFTFDIKNVSTSPKSDVYVPPKKVGSQKSTSSSLNSVKRKMAKWGIATLDSLLVIGHLTLVYIVFLFADDLVLKQISRSFGDLINQSDFAKALLLGTQIFSAVGTAIAYALHLIYSLYVEALRVRKAFGSENKAI